MTIQPHEAPAEVATRDAHPPAESPAADLIAWAEEARHAHQIAQSLAKSSFVPASMKGSAENVTAAILAGRELGLQPMASLRSMDIIQGTPALRAHAMRGLIQSHGHSVQLVESSPTRCVMRGRRRGEAEWQEVTWTIERAAQLGLTGKDQWKRQPQTMLEARATGQICRLIASDAIHAMPYASEELGASSRAPAPPSVSVEEIAARGTAPPQDHAQPAAAEPFAPLDAGEVDGEWERIADEEAS